MFKQKVVTWVFRHIVIEFKSGLYYELLLLILRVLATFWSKLMTVFQNNLPSIYCNLMVYKQGGHYYYKKVKILKFFLCGSFFLQSN